MANIETFRSELSAWLDAHAPQTLAGLALGEMGGNWGGRRPTWDHPDMKPWLERAAARGLTAPTWPREYGGGGLEPAEAKLLAQELARRRLPPPLIGFGLTHDRPDAAALRHARSRSASTCRRSVAARSAGARATPSPMRARISRRSRPAPCATAITSWSTGTKVWTSYADQSDWIFALVRSDPNAKKQEGITFLLIDMASPGVVGAPDPADQRRVAVLRDALRRRARAGRERHPRDQRGLDRRQGAARPRAQHDRGHLRRRPTRKQGARGSPLVEPRARAPGRRRRGRCPTPRCATRSPSASSTSAPSA